MTASNPVKEDHAEGILTLTVNRPERLNAWNKEVREALAAGFEKATADDAVGAVILTGAGARAFSAGQDLSETQAIMDAEGAVAWVSEMERFFDRFRRVEKPVVCALNGLAVGAAFQIALMSDVVVGHPGVRMGQTEINAGIPSIIGPWVMNPILGPLRTRELSLTGRMMAADECHRLGLIHHLVAAEGVQDKAVDVARELAAKPPVAMALTKREQRLASEDGFRAVYERAKVAQAEAFASGEPQRVMAAFLARREAGA